jgi:hypothetical protein
MYFGERRRSNRQTISRHAKLQLAGGSLSRDCVITDISDGGVRLHVEGFDVPDEFVLLLSDGAGAARPRDCKVAWRLGFEVGAEFLDVSGSRGKQRGFASAGQAAGG